MGDGGGAARGRAQRRQGRARRAQPPARFRRRSRAGAAREQRRPRDARRDDRRGGRVAARASAATSAPRRGCSATTAGCRGGTSSRRSATSREVSWDRARPTLVRDAFAGYSPELAGAGRHARSPSSWVDAEIRDGKRGGAYCASVDRRRQPRDDELRRQPGLGVDARARARPRVPQRRARGAHADAAPPADGARRDRVDLLRDAALRAAPSARGATRRASGAARHLPRRRDAGRRRHPQPVPVRDRAVPDGAGARALSVADLQRDDARRAGRGVRRRPRIPTTATRTCGR